MESTQLEPQLEPQIQPEAQLEQTQDWKRFGMDILETIVLAIVLYFGINALSARVRVDGFSMIPTLQNGEYILVNKLAYKTGQPNRGDIIVFRLPGDESQDLIKRVIGLPGDTIEVRNGQVYVNGAALAEPYLSQPTNSTIPARQVEPGRYFVMGDNRNNSSDSRSFGSIARSDIVGRAWVVYWPPSDWEAVPHYSYAATTP